MAKLPAPLRKAIAEIPGSDGWWHSSGQDTFEELAERLLAAGMTTEDALGILEGAYGAAAGEFGA